MHFLCTFLRIFTFWESLHFFCQIFALFFIIFAFFAYFCTFFWESLHFFGNLCTFFRIFSLFVNFFTLFVQIMPFFLRILHFFVFFTGKSYQALTTTKLINNNNEIFFSWQARELKILFSVIYISVKSSTN